MGGKNRYCMKVPPNYEEFKAKMLQDEELRKRRKFEAETEYKVKGYVS